MNALEEYNASISYKYYPTRDQEKAKPLNGYGNICESLGHAVELVFHLNHNDEILHMVASYVANYA